MTWNGTDITGVPTFIYHDELFRGTGPITDPDGPGRLICRSLTQTAQPVRWLDVSGSIVRDLHSQSSAFFQRRKTLSNVELSRLSLSTTYTIMRRANTSGLWICGPPGMRVYVGLYARVEGK